MYFYNYNNENNLCIYYNYSFSKMELNLITFGYLFFRLAPFILTCFFTLSSLFNQDFKGVVLLIGLLIACFIGSVVGRLVNFKSPPEAVNNEFCNMISLGHVTNISQLPLGQVIISYIFIYLVMFISLNKVALQNIATLVFFPLLIILDALWNVNKSCFTIQQILFAIFVGVAVGSLWGWIIFKYGSPKIQYYIGFTDKQVCGKPQRNTFKCNVYKNGKLLNSTKM